MSKRYPKVCLITPNHLSTNPRLVKEAVALEANGYAVHIIFTQYDRFQTSEDEKILNEHPHWNFSALNWNNGSLKARLIRMVTGICKGVSERLLPFVSLPLLHNLVVNRNFFWQLNKAVKVNADLYIAHNLGALPVARIAARKRGVKSGFDAEDFHRHELKDNPLDRDVLVKAAVEARYVPGVNHFTAASPLIGKAYGSLFPSMNAVSVLNVFSRTEGAVETSSRKKPLKLFWFSQTVGPDRGIEDIIKALGQCGKGNFELHLLGKCHHAVKDYIDSLATEAGVDKNLVFFHDTVPEREIFSLASKCDIGMACETGKPLNRDICLTNKIFTYIQSGLAVVASDTEAQRALMQQYPSAGKLYERGCPSSIATVLESYYQDPELLALCKRNNFLLGQSQLNWEVEQKKFIKSVEQVLN